MMTIRSERHHTYSMLYLRFLVGHGLDLNVNSNSELNQDLATRRGLRFMPNDSDRRPELRRSMFQHLNGCGFSIRETLRVASAQVS